MPDTELGLKKMKKETILSFLAALIISATFSSCSDGGDGNESGDGVTLTDSYLQVYKWVFSDASLGEGDGSHIWFDTENYTLYFLSSNTGMGYFAQRDYDTDLGYHKTTSAEMFTYTVSGNRLTIKYDKSGSTYTLTYNNGYLLLNGNPAFKRYPMSSGDYEIIEKNKPVTGKCGKDLTYAYDSDEHILYITGTGDMYDYQMSDDRPWTELQIYEIDIDNGCTSIGNYAFEGLKYLKDVYLPNSVTNIGDWAFGRTNIKDVSLPNKIRRIGIAAFAYCSHLERADFIKCTSLETIEDGAFSQCPLELGDFNMEIDMPNLKTIGRDAFISATFTSLTLNERLEEIGQYAFSGWAGKVNVSKLVIPNSVKTIGEYAFSGSFSEIRIGTGVRQLGDRAFISTKSGKIYVNLGVPLTNIGNVIIADADEWESNEGSWTLYVPKGSKVAYQRADVWKKFKYIYEDSSLQSGNGTPDDNGGEDIPNLSNLIKGKWAYEEDINDEDWINESILFDQKRSGSIHFEHVLNNEWGISADGTYVLNGNTLTATYTSVSVDSKLAGNGFVDGRTRTVIYEVISCNNSKLVLKNITDGIAARTYEKY